MPDDLLCYNNGRQAQGKVSYRWLNVQTLLLPEAGMFESHRERLLNDIETAHAAYYQSGVFGGPSLYFHHHALIAGRTGDLGRFAESTYALLAAWGMHRMGRGGSKMREFDEFRRSLEPLWATVLSLQQAAP